MPFSQVDTMFQLSPNTFILSLVKFSSERPNGRNSTSGVGLVILEGLDENNRYIAFCIGYPFNLPYRYEITKVKTTNDTFNLPLSSSTQTFEIRKNSEVLELLDPSKSFPEIDLSTMPDYSYKRAVMLAKHLGVSFGEIDILNIGLPDWYLKDKSVRWNPFPPLIESKYFPAARILRSSLWDRIKDTFFILGGNPGLKNELGLLDYVFPFPRLLTAALGTRIPTAIKGLLLIPTSILWLAKFVTAALLTVAALPFIGITHLVASLAKRKQDQQIENLKVKKIKGELESITDLNENNDLLPETSFGSYPKIRNTLPKVNVSLVIKPLAKNDKAVYEELSPQRPFDKNKDELVLGVFETQAEADASASKENLPGAIIEITPNNYAGIFALMKKNDCKIDKELEDNKVMDQVLSKIKH